MSTKTRLSVGDLAYSREHKDIVRVVARQGHKVDVVQALTSEPLPAVSRSALRPMVHFKKRRRPALTPRQLFEKVQRHLAATG